MTTIAYCHKDREIAVDSRQTMGSFIATDKANKIMKTDKGIFFLAGGVADCEFLANNYPEISNEESSAYGIAVIDGDVFWLSNHNGKADTVKCTHDMTAGSGEAYAQAALDFGCNARDAVEYAMTRDNCTGGKVRVFKVG